MTDTPLARLERWIEITDRIHDPVPDECFMGSMGNAENGYFTKGDLRALIARVRELETAADGYAEHANVRGEQAVAAESALAAERVRVVMLRGRLIAAEGLAKASSDPAKNYNAIQRIRSCVSEALAATADMAGMRIVPVALVNALGKATASVQAYGRGDGFGERGGTVTLHFDDAVNVDKACDEIRAMLNGGSQNARLGILNNEASAPSKPKPQP